MTKRRQFSRFLGYVLSDSHQGSIRRLIGLLSFTLLMVLITLVAFRVIPVTNVSLLSEGMKYLFAIISIALLGVTATDVAKIMKSQKTEDQPTIEENEEEEQNTSRKDDTEQ